MISCRVLAVLRPVPGVDASRYCGATIVPPPCPYHSRGPRTSAVCVGGIICSVHGPLHLLYIVFDNVRSTARYIWVVEMYAVPGPLHTPRLPPLIGPGIRPAVWMFHLVPVALGQVYVLRLSVLCLSQVWYVELAMYSCLLWGVSPFSSPNFRSSPRRVVRG